MTATTICYKTLRLAKNLEKCLWLLGFKQLKHSLFSWTSFHLSSNDLSLKTGQFGDSWPALQKLQLGPVSSRASPSNAEAVYAPSSPIRGSDDFLLLSLPLLLWVLFTLQPLSPASLDTTWRFRNFKNNSRSFLSCCVSASSNSYFSSNWGGNLVSKMGNKIQPWLVGSSPRASNALALFTNVS